MMKGMNTRKGMEDKHAFALQVSYLRMEIMHISQQSKLVSFVSYHHITTCVITS